MRSLTVGEVEGDYDVDGSYSLTPGGEKVHKTGVSVRHLLASLGVTVDGGDFAHTSNPNGTWDILDAADLAAQPDFDDGPPLIYVNGGSTAYFRPVQGSHSANTISTPGIGQPLDLFVNTGNLLSVTAEADRSSAHPGRTIGFAAHASGGLPGERLEYSWQFDDGTIASGAAVNHAYAAAGFYRAQVTVQGDKGSGGTALTSVDVGKAPAPAGHQPGGGKSTTPGAPSSGPAAGSGKGGQSTGGHGSGSGQAPSSSKSHKHTTVHTKPKPKTATSTAQQPSTPASTPSAAPSKSAHGHPAAGATPARKRAGGGAGASSGLPVVHGVLLASVASPAPGSAAAAAAAAGRPAASHTPARQPLALPFGLLATLALILAGAGREAGGSRRLRGSPA